ncbi:Hypothetical protein A7982_10279 [Minicystis rosea]|nr:Hypothetical protein A7982_10279 [Minicystis rosea]
MDFAPLTGELTAPAPADLDAPPSNLAAPAPDGTSPSALDGIVAALADKARTFARTSPREKATLLRALVPRLSEIAPALAAQIAATRGLDPASPAAAEGFFAGALPMIALARLLAESLEDIASAGRPALSLRDLQKRADGRVVARLPPRAWAERIAQRHRETMVLFTSGTEPEDVIAGQAAFYRTTDPEGGIALVLADPSDATSGVQDALFACFVEGHVVLLALPPDATAVEAMLRSALAPLLERGFLHLARLDEDARTHLDARSDIAARLGSTPGSVNPMIVIPCLYAKDELSFVTRSLASQLAHNASLDPAAPRVIVLPEGWPQRELFLELLQKAFSAIPPRRRYLPHAAARFAALTVDRRDAIRIGEGTADTLPWTILPNIDPTSDDPIFSTTSGAGPVLALVSLGSDDPATMLPAATAFCNDRLSGSLAAELVMHPIHEDDPAIAATIERCLIDLRYGAVGINAWPALLRWGSAAPWGSALPGAGFRNNARMLARIDKAVIEGSLHGLRKPVHFQDNAEARRIAERMVSFAAAPKVSDLWTIAGR